VKLQDHGGKTETCQTHNRRISELLLICHYTLLKAFIR
jgi:hypothetical protein